VAKYIIEHGKLRLSGKLGGLVFAKNGTVRSLPGSLVISKDGRVRSLAERTGAVSAGQKRVRKRFKEAVMLWGSLPAGEKEAWHARARGFKGKSRGFFAFMSAQLRQGRGLQETPAREKTRLR
jgi:hypothetical protein